MCLICLSVAAIGGTAIAIDKKCNNSKITGYIKDKFHNIKNFKRMKTLCQTHHLYYGGNECPMCRQERIERYCQKFCTNEHKVIPSDNTNDREITDDDINKLLNKFNRKAV